MILTIETSIKSGSLAIFNKSQLVDFWTGNETVSRSEDLIFAIKNLLARNEIKGEGIEKIIVSRGPGSFTGLRVGTATAMGLALGWGCPLAGISILAANFLDSRQTDGVSIISTGRNSYSWQFFTLTAESGIFSGDLNLLAATINSANSTKIITSRIITNEIAGLTKSASDKDGHFFTDEKIPAVLLGSKKVRESRFLTEDISPIYVRPATNFKV